MNESLIVIEQKDTARVIRINRPDKRNALSVDMMWTLAGALDAAAGDRAVRTVIVCGNGPCFSSGVDVMSLAQLSQQQTTTAEFRHFLARFQAVFTRMETMEKPVIAAMHSHCLGMALELALAADFRIASDDAVFGLPEVQLGLIPDVGGTSRLTRLLGPARAKELIMLARRIDADKALAYGLLHEVAPAGGHLDAAFRMAAELDACAPLAVGMAKKIINRGAHLDGETFRELEAYAQSALLKTEDVNEGVMAKIQKRAPQFKGK